MMGPWSVPLSSLLLLIMFLILSSFAGLCADLMTAIVRSMAGLRTIDYSR